MSNKSSQNTSKTPKELVDTLIHEMYLYAKNDLLQKLTPPKFDYLVLSKNTLKSLYTDVGADSAKKIIEEATGIIKYLDSKMKNIEATISALPVDEQHEILNQLKRQKELLLSGINFCRLIVDFQKINEELEDLVANIATSNKVKLRSKLDVLKKHVELLNYDLASHQISSVLVFKLRQSVNINIIKLDEAINNVTNSTESENTNDGFEKSASYLRFMKESSSLLSKAHEERKYKSLIKDLANKFVHDIVLTGINYHEDLKLILSAVKTENMSSDEIDLYIQFSKAVYNNFVNNKIFSSKMIDSLTGDLKKRAEKELVYIEEALLAHITTLEMKSENRVANTVTRLKEILEYSRSLEEKTLEYIKRTQDTLEHQKAKLHDPHYAQETLSGLKNMLCMIGEELEEKKLLIENMVSEFPTSSEVQAALSDIEKINEIFLGFHRDQVPELIRKVTAIADENAYNDVKSRIQVTRSVIDHKNQILNNLSQRHLSSLDSFAELKQVLDQLKKEYDNNQLMIRKLNQSRVESRVSKNIVNILNKLNKDLDKAMTELMVKIKVLGGQDMVLSRISEVKLKPNWDKIDQTIKNVEAKLVAEASLLNVSRHKLLNAKVPIKLEEVSAINLDTLLSRSNASRQEIFEAISYLDGLKDLIQEFSTDATLTSKISQYQHALFYKNLYTKHYSMKKVCEEIIAILMDKSGSKKSDFTKLLLKACDDYAVLLVPNPKTPMSTKEMEDNLAKISELPVEMQTQVMNKFPQFDQQLHAWIRGSMDSTVEKTEVQIFPRGDSTKND